MKNYESTLQGCPYDSLTEMLCLDSISSEDEKKKAQLHLQQCRRCRDRFQELEIVYTQVNKEVRKPVMNRVLDLAKQIRNKETKYGLVVCEPLNGKNDKVLSYKTKVLFTANGAGVNAHTRLEDFDLVDLPQESIAIRAMTDVSRNKLLLYLWRSENEDFSNLELRLPGSSEKATFSESGMSQISMMNIEDLGDKVVYFEEKQKTASAAENRFMSIVNSISLK